MFQGALTNRHLAVLDSPLLSNNLRNLRRWLFKAYEMFGRESNSEDMSLEIMIDFPPFTPKRRREDDDDDFDEPPNGGPSTGSSLLLLNMVEA